MKKFISLLLIAGLLTVIVLLGQERVQGKAEADSTNLQSQATISGRDEDKSETQLQKPVITFVELGSVKCIPCKKMQPVMKSIEEKYAGLVEVIFYDVWKADQKKYAKQYKVISIPTQVFLDSTGAEITRHIGFYPEKEIDKFLLSQGVTPVKTND